MSFTCNYQGRTVRSPIEDSDLKILVLSMRIRGVSFLLQPGFSKHLQMAPVRRHPQHKCCFPKFIRVRSFLFGMKERADTAEGRTIGNREQPEPLRGCYSRKFGPHVRAGGRVLSPPTSQEVLQSDGASPNSPPAVDCPGGLFGSTSCSGMVYDHELFRRSYSVFLLFVIAAAPRYRKRRRGHYRQPHKLPRLVAVPSTRLVGQSGWRDWRRCAPLRGSDCEDHPAAEGSNIDTEHR